MPKRIAKAGWLASLAEAGRERAGCYVAARQIKLTLKHSLRLLSALSHDSKVMRNSEELQNCHSRNLRRMTVLSLDPLRSDRVGTSHKLFVTSSAEVLAEPL